MYCRPSKHSSIQVPFAPALPLSDSNTFPFCCCGSKIFIYFKYVYPTLLQANTLQDFLFPCGILTEFERWYLKIRLLWMLSSSSAKLLSADLPLPALQMSSAITKQYASSAHCLQLLYRYSVVMRTWTNQEATPCDNWWTAICKLPMKVAHEISKARVKRQKSLHYMRCSISERMKKANWRPNCTPFKCQKKVGVSI